MSYTGAHHPNDNRQESRNGAAPEARHTPRHHQTTPGLRWSLHHTHR